MPSRRNKIKLKYAEYGVTQDPFVIVKAEASCDCIVTKSGYGTFVEATACGTPVLYVERPDWPEEPCLVAWLRQHNVSMGISRSQLEQGDFANALRKLTAQTRATPIAPIGIEEAANYLLERLGKLH